MATILIVPHLDYVTVYYIKVQVKTAYNFYLTIFFFILQTDKTGIKAKLSEALKSIGNVKSSSKIEASEETSEDEEDSGHESNSNDDDQDPMDNNWKTDLAQKASEAFYQRLVFE